MKLSHLLKYNAKIIFTSRDSIIWGIIFPLVYGLVYMFTIAGSVDQSTIFDPIPLAVVYEGSAEEIADAREAMGNFGTTGELVDGEVVADDVDEGDLIVFIDVEEEEIAELLESATLTLATVINNDEGSFDIEMYMTPSAVNSIEANIVYSVMNGYTSTSEAYFTAYEVAASSADPMTAVTELTNGLEAIDLNQVYIRENASTENVNIYSNFYYVALAYLSIFFMSTGVNIVTENEANYSTQALRTTVSPVPKYKRFTATFITTWIPSVLVVYVLLAIYWFAGIPIGTHYGPMIGLLTLGVTVGLLLGTALAGVFKFKQGVLTGISIGLPLVFAVLSGMMTKEIKVLITKEVPWLNFLNPLALVNDAIYYLNHYPNNALFNRNVLILAGYAVVLLAITLVSLRRTDYENL